eukprot:TRINITY_DN319_c2_g1_i2.p1 TRINITY_DN319_c2_g1~~TRINITY_DN319_c2_g1_i2.p1  ORF type:complete len:907 (-),score=428.56 TRINITY_DN319_c2_g1_i2:77-2740(-)
MFKNNIVWITLIFLISLFLLISPIENNSNNNNNEHLLYLRAFNKPLNTLITPTFSSKDLKTKEFITRSKTIFSNLNQFQQTQSQYIVQLKSTLTLETKTKYSKIVGYSIDKYGYIPENSYLIVCNESVITKIENQFETKWIAIWSANYKIDNLIDFSNSNSNSNSNIIQSISFIVFTINSESINCEIIINQIQQALISFNLPTNLISFQIIHNSRILITLNSIEQSLLFKILDLFAHHPNIHFIEQKLQVKLLNKQASWIMQSNTTSNFAIYNNNLHGEGQIVGCADTGIDFDNCLFNDPEQSVSMDGTPNMAHRKIVGMKLRPEAIEGDVINGHGTHVAGSIAGEALFSDSQSQTYAAQGNGMAYKAKLAFLSIGRNDSSLDVPATLDDGEFFQFAYDLGARIHSNSWGCGSLIPQICNRYDSNAVDVDTYMFRNKDFLIVFAGGNSGDGADEELHSIGSPATAKNCLSVGASQNDYETSWKNITKYMDFNERVTFCCTGNNCPITIAECCSSQFASCCCPGTFQKIINDNPSLYQKESVAKFSSEGPGNFNSNRLKPDIVAPGSQIVSAHSDGDLSTLQCDPITPNFGNKASLLAMQGTSMATPITSGAAAIVRQYLSEGYYPTGKKNSENQIQNISASLVKSMLIASAQNLQGLWTGYNTNSLTVPASPSFQQGYGRIQLNQVLFFSNNDDNNDTDTDSNSIPLFIDDSTTLSVGQLKNYTFELRNANILRAVIAWTDPPALVSTAKPLVNNLDLTVTAPNGTIYYGNDAGVYHTGSSNFIDDENNVERVEISKPQDGIWTVKVVAKAINAEESQHYSIVIVLDGQSSSHNDGDSGLSILEISLIAVGVFIAVLLVVGLIFFIVKKSKSKPKSKELDEPLLNEI